MGSISLLLLKQTSEIRDRVRPRLYEGTEDSRGLSTSRATREFYKPLHVRIFTTISGHEQLHLDAAGDQRKSGFLVPILLSSHRPNRVGGRREDDSALENDRPRPRREWSHTHAQG